MGIFSNKKSIKKVIKSIPYEIVSDVFFADISHHEEDFNGKTYNAKVASSIGVPTVPNAGTKAYDIVSFSYAGAAVNTFGTLNCFGEY